ncbi:MAG: aminotransferase class I/II-fold pyridoxal phosphate-dependent enzyme [Oscillospiraceae bacterium]|nr:aminotransferase class I/II-fold pyridoxal phosphate-dependent enzyme [Oscillospiraceae bacterium]
MFDLTKCSKKELTQEYENQKKKYREYLALGISINMARGRPSPEQLDLSDDLLNLNKNDIELKDASGADCRNYGVLNGTLRSRELFGDMLGVSAENVITCGSSSLNLMFDYISQCCTHGTLGNDPWFYNKNRKFIAIVPGYDRHFAIAEYFGLEMISVPMTPSGPDMDVIEEVIKDPDVKGMFCVPKYSNPDGVTYSAETVERIASMKPAAPDFRVIWDEAYLVHDLYEEGDFLANIFDAAKKYGTEENFIAFASTSKITFAGAGLSAVAAADRNIKEIMDRLALQTICYDKINQARHTAIYKNMDDIRAQMKKHAILLRPKFDTVLGVLHSELDGSGIASFNSPRGGYFISLNVNVGSAKYAGKLCADCGLTLTGVGATYPYGIDPTDSNIRIAPSCPSVEELEMASKILCSAVKIAACEELLGIKN